MEINCGLALLSILAAKAGAKEVYSVNFSTYEFFKGGSIRDNGVY